MSLPQTSAWVLAGPEVESEAYLPATILEDLGQLLHAEQRPAPPQNYRLIGTGAQILRHLGLSDLQLMSAPLHFNALSGFNLNVTEFMSAPGR